MQHVLPTSWKGPRQAQAQGKLLPCVECKVSQVVWGGSERECWFLFLKWEQKSLQRRIHPHSLPSLFVSFSILPQQVLSAILSLSLLFFHPDCDPASCSAMLYTAQYSFFFQSLFVSFFFNHCGCINQECHHCCKNFPLGCWFLLSPSPASSSFVDPLSRLWHSLRYF